MPALKWRIMWTVVLFDLPVDDPVARKRATRFRLFLLDEGFHMSQFSVYARSSIGREENKALVERIRRAIPPYGKVHIMRFTDKQYGDIITVHGMKEEQMDASFRQFDLF